MDLFYQIKGLILGRIGLDLWRALNARLKLSSRQFGAIEDFLVKT